MEDNRGRALRDLRVSVTDRCNFRCPYCMPRDLFGADHAFLPRAELLTFEEITRLVTVFAGLGVTKVRLTGGEPLLRRDLPDLVRRVAAVEGVADVAMTTNGSLLAPLAAELRAAGLDRVTVSLDSLDPEVFRLLSDTAVPLEQVLAGIDAAAAAGLPVKLNAVLRRGVNDDGVLDLVEYARERGHTLRVIEYMDVGTTNGWVRDEVVPGAEVRKRIAAVHTLEPLGVEGTADRWRYADGAGEIGFVSSVTQPFCGTCTRARLTAVGELFTCLFATTGTDLRAPLRERLHVETPAGDAWRCLRCATFVVGEPHGAGPASHAPVVLRGKALKDATILRLLAAERFGRGLLLLALAYGVHYFQDSKASIKETFDKAIPAARPLANVFNYDLDTSPTVERIRKLLESNQHTLTIVIIGLVAYAALQLTEGVGLFLLKRWGEYVAVVGTSVFVPFEVYELTHHVTWLKVAALLVNLAAVVYLVWTKRLFGLRGGHAAFQAERDAQSLLEVEAAALTVDGKKPPLSR